MTPLELKALREELMVAQWDRDNPVTDDPEAIAGLDERLETLQRAYDDAVAHVDGV